MILLFLLNSLYAQSCFDGTITGKDLCTVEDRFFDVFKNLRPSHIGKSQDDYLLDSVNSYYLTELGSTLYDRLVMVDKPTLSEMQSTLASIVVIEKAKITFDSNVDSLKNKRMLLVECNAHEPNIAIAYKKIKEQNNQTLYDCLKSKETAIEEKVTKDIQRTSRIKNGRKIRIFCDDVLDLIVGYSIGKGFSKTQVDTIQATFSSIEKLLKDKRPFTAKPLIEAVAVDGVLVTQEIKDSILELYTKNGF